MPLAVADAGSHPALADFLAREQGVTLLKIERGAGSALVRQIKAAALHAAHQDRPFVLYTEPDKQWFFEHRLEQFLDVASRQSDAGAVLAARDESSFRTFPEVQQLTERLTNELIGSILGQRSDFLYGPFLFPSRLLRFIQCIPDDLGWGWRIFLFALACRLGLPLRSFTSDLPCPAGQRHEGDEKAREHRLAQMAENVRGLREGLRYPLP